MNSRPDFCPGCGAQVYPEESHCPFCGRGLRSSPWLSFIMGLGGAAAALVVGALIWWVLDALPGASDAAAPPAQQQAAATPEAASPAAPPAAAPAASPSLAQPSSVVAPPASSAGVPPLAASPAGTAPAGTAATAAARSAAAPAPVAGSSPFQDPPEALGYAKDAQRFATATPGTAAPGANPLDEQQLALPTMKGPTPEVAADMAARKDFAKSTQERFTQNGLDLTVATSGEAESVLTIKFNFPAKTAAELIVAGPFPRQCEQRGFKQVVFVDPSGVSWLYDVSTQKMTEK